MTARVLVDSNVLLDVITSDPAWGEWSTRTLAGQLKHGAPVINAIVYAEIAFDFETIEAVVTGGIPVVGGEGGEEQYNPVVIRTKEFPAERCSIEEAVDQMELVGHDFFLFIEAESGRPSVVYRRKGWNYGVISLSDD